MVGGDRPAAPAASALAPGGVVGLYAAEHFRLLPPGVAAPGLLPQARWYFRDETVAIPAPDSPVAGFTPGIAPSIDLNRWQRDLGAAVPGDLPPLVWLTAPERLAGCRLAADGTALATTTGRLPLAWAPRHPLNRSYLDPSSIAFLTARDLAVRGDIAGDTFVVRSVWPRDFRVAPPLPPRPVPAPDDLRGQVRQCLSEVPRGGATAPFAAWRLWERTGATQLAGKPVLAFIANGAQGDDDEAHAGHFAIVTGRIGADGGIADWLVNDFYNLDAESEKAIIAAPVPLDSYMGDLNAGQAWYRPSIIVVAVLRDADAAQLVQAALGRVYNHFYRRDLVYYHPDVNCTSLSVDTLRSLGLPVAARPPSGPLLATLGFPLLAARRRSLAKAKVDCDYLLADPVRLLPAVALEEVLAALHGIATGPTPAAAASSLAGRLARDLDALLLLRIPQFPSSRAWGDAPVFSLAEYRSRLPADPALLQIVPVPPRPLPAALVPADVTPPPPHRSEIVALVWGCLVLIGIPCALRALWRRVSAAAAGTAR